MTRAEKTSRPNGATRQDPYTSITNQILANLAQGVTPWTKPWTAGHAAGPVSRPLRHSFEPYSGINTLVLWGTAVERGYAAPIWMTFPQALELGGAVRKGEKSTTVVYANRITRQDTNDQGEDVERSIPFLKAYPVFNVEQIDGLPERFRAAPVTLPESERIARADAFLAATKAEVVHGGDMACYELIADRIRIPEFGAFASAHDYYATRGHETVHWTRHPSRLDRDLGRKTFGDEGYAREELVAELGAAFLCAELGVDLRPREDHAAYIGHWLTVLSQDKRAIFSAAAHAQKALDYLKGLQPPG
ncbi:ArdC family protein [Caulobacter sp. UNC279MFTsu5.1]|uniref:ArdC family protein n=1 Tax=Caulobacter sp. UNC279MFTsu5.1 TaxID=1502775 RepID=UPI0008F04F86|nr:zincin-like metallopeptidase domain-containing protein [Caulobacter sp. UNC279MFTsu5.1]SFI51679.1 Antirestriction protein ArdC [Caulobacter sp. UNC279MFTsu5.1]